MRFLSDNGLLEIKLKYSSENGLCGVKQNKKKNIYIFTFFFSSGNGLLELIYL